MARGFYTLILEVTETTLLRDLDTPQGTAPTALARGIVDMARAPDLEILAQGVELESQQQILSDLGCTLSQGYLYSKPLNPSDFADFARDI